MKKFSSATDLARLELWMPSSLRVLAASVRVLSGPAATLHGADRWIDSRTVDFSLPETPRYLPRARVDSPRFLSEDAHGFRRNAYFRLVERSSDRVSRDFSLPGAWNERCEKNRRNRGNSFRCCSRSGCLLIDASARMKNDAREGGPEGNGQTRRTLLRVAAAAVAPK